MMWGEMSRLELVSVVLCFFGGIMMLFDGILWVMSYGFQRYYYAPPLDDLTVGSVKIVLALIVLVGAWFIQDHGHGREVLGGAIVIVFSIVGLFASTSFYIVVMIPAIIGGILAIIGHLGKHPIQEAQKT